MNPTPIEIQENKTANTGLLQNVTKNEPQHTKRKYGERKKHSDPLIPIDVFNSVSNKRSTQSCDRCRLKKIKCIPNNPQHTGLSMKPTDDGCNTSCYNCLKIHYKCEYSDKLTRRGFPKGYTDMLELKIIELQKIVDQHPVIDRSLSKPSAQCDISFHDVATNFSSNNENVYMGTMPLQFLKTHSCKNDTSFGKPTLVDLGQIIDQVLTNAFQFQYETFIPKCLNNAVLDSSYILALVDRLLDYELVLLPILYPKQDWKSFCMQQLKNGNQRTNANNDYYIFCGFLIVMYQWIFKRFDDSDVFQLIKLINMHNYNTKNTPRCLQLLLFTTYYATTLPLETAYKFQMINETYAKIINMGLLFPSYYLQNKDFNEETQLMIVYSFQFLQKWINLTSGKPKLDYSIENFYATTSIIENLKHLNGKIPKYLKSFVLLCEFIIEDVRELELNADNCSKSLGKLEKFYNVLVEFNLYHTIEEHLITEYDDTEDNSNKPNVKKEKNRQDTYLNEMNDYESRLMQLRFFSPDLSTSQYMEIQMTLYYLVLKMFVLKKNEEEETDYDLIKEILSLYYIVYSNNYTNTELRPIFATPKVFHIMKLLPIDNLGIIQYCLKTLQDRFANNDNSILITLWSGIVSSLQTEYSKYYSGVPFATVLTSKAQFQSLNTGKYNLNYITAPTANRECNEYQKHVVVTPKKSDSDKPNTPRSLVENNNIINGTLLESPRLAKPAINSLAKQYQ